MSRYFWPTSWILQKQLFLSPSTASESIAHSVFGLMGYKLKAHSGSRNNYYYLPYYDKCNVFKTCVTHPLILCSHLNSVRLVSFWFIVCIPVNLNIVFNVTFLLLFTICTIYINYFYWLFNWIQFGVFMCILFYIDRHCPPRLAFAICGQWENKIVNLN